MELFITQLSSGLLAGFELTVNLVLIPALIETNNPLPGWKKCYNNVLKSFALTTPISLMSGLRYYYLTNNITMIYSLLCTLLVLLWTIIIIGPVNKILFDIEENDININYIISKWNNLQWGRTILSITAFIITILIK